MDSYAIETTNVSRSFANRLAVRDLNLRVRRGSIYGLLGRNGAGKTTVIKMLAGLIWPDRGEIRVNGLDPKHFTAENRWRIGYVSERQILNPFLRVGALIRFTSSFYPDWDAAACERMLKRYRIDPARRIRALSAGTMRQLAFILAAAQRPDLLILDEPAANLDVVARREVLDELQDMLREEGRTVLISSHILSDIERVADEIGIIADGRLVVSEPLDRLKETVKKVRFYGFENGSAEKMEVPNAFRRSRSGNEVLAVMRIEAEAEIEELARRSRCRHEITHLNLEEIFVELMREPEKTT